MDNSRKSLDNTEFLIIAFYKKYEIKPLLSDYFNFATIVCSLYKAKTQEASLILALEKLISSQRKKLDCKLSSSQFEGILSRAKASTWSLKISDLEKSANFSATDTLTQNFRRNNKYKGIKNAGNTCYLAATLQALFATQEFRMKILESLEEMSCSSLTNIVSGEDSKKKDILEQTRRIFFQLIASESESVDPYNFKKALPDQFSLANTEQDAFEFLQVYLDCLEKQLGPEVINNLFGGEMLTKWECQQCFISRAKKSVFLHLGLNFRETEGQYEDLVQMLIRNFENSVFEEEASLNCDNCKTKSLLTLQKIEITQVPQYLIIVLNRFYFRRGEQQGCKISTNVDIHPFIDLVDILRDQINVRQAKYQLYAIVIHKGSSSEHGHYYSLIRDNEDPNLWVLLNDSLTYSLAEGENHQEHLNRYKEDTPYILFYKKH